MCSFNQNPWKLSVKKLIHSEVVRCQSASLQQNPLSNMLLHVFLLHFLRTHHDYFFWGDFESSDTWQFICSITIHYTPKSISSCWIWHLTLSWERFLSNKQIGTLLSCNTCYKQKVNREHYKNTLLLAQPI